MGKFDNFDCLSLSFEDLCHFGSDDYSRNLKAIVWKARIGFELIWWKWCFSIASSSRRARDGCLRDVIISLNNHVFDFKIAEIVINLFFASHWSFIRNFKSIPIFLPYFFDFRLISLIIHVNYVKLIHGFQNIILRPPTVYIPNLNFMQLFLP